MHETENDLRELQDVLDRSYATAGAHLRSIWGPKQRMSAEQVVKAMRGMCLLHLATVAASGAPLVGPVDGVFYRGRLWFGSARDSVRFRHVRARPAVSAAHTRGEDLAVIVHGVAHEIDTSTGEYDGLRAYYGEVYGKTWETWGHWENAAYAWVQPRRMYAALMNPKALQD